MAKPEDKTILVVDDEEDVRDYLSTVLEDAGFNVVTAGDGNEAIERLKEKVPDFISLDLVMPNKSGMRFLREMRSNQKWVDIPFVVVTAHADDELGRGDLQDIMAERTGSRPNLCLEKPVKPERYLSLICERLGIECDQVSKGTHVEELRKELIDKTKSANVSQLEEMLRAYNKLR